MIHQIALRPKGNRLFIPSILSYNLAEMQVSALKGDSLAEYWTLYILSYNTSVTKNITSSGKYNNKSLSLLEKQGCAARNRLYFLTDL